MPQAILIKNISIRSNNIELEWNDGEISNFHFMWLRDNCPLGIHPHARHRMFNSYSVSGLTTDLLLGPDSAFVPFEGSSPAETPSAEVSVLGEGDPSFP